MKSSIKELRAGWFEVDVINDEFADYGVKSGDVATFRPVTKIRPGRIYAFEIDNPIPELRGYLLRLAIKDAGGKVLLCSAISAVDAEKIKDIMPVAGELARVNGRVVSQVRC